jgi:hypothetical protein
VYWNSAGKAELNKLLSRGDVGGAERGICLEMRDIGTVVDYSIGFSEDT